MRPILALAALLPGAALADDIAAPAGCEIVATLVQHDCEIHQVMSCEGKPPETRLIDVYYEGVFRGSSEFFGIHETVWRRGSRLQEVTVDEAVGRALLALAPGETLEMETTRSRRILPAGPDEADIATATRRTTAGGPASLDLPGGGTREVLVFAEELTAEDGARIETTRHYDPALGAVLRTEWESFPASGGSSAGSLGSVGVILPGEPGFATGTAPEGSACTPG